MRATAFEFRFRLLIISVIIGLGFWSPGLRTSSVWMLSAGWLAHQQVLGIQTASLSVGYAAAALALLAAALRTWAAAYIGSGVVLSGDFHSQHLVAAGPFRYVRNPLYLGAELHFLALAIFMPLYGAIFAVVANAFFFARIIAAEEALLLASATGYREYFARVPRILPALRPRVPAAMLAPRWGQAFLGEIYCWGAAISFLFLVPSYNVIRILQAVLISLGVSFVVKGLWPAPKTAIVAA
jgi:protein-S-isoprenylcysteine O-methyltransferase Ste14